MQQQAQQAKSSMPALAAVGSGEASPFSLPPGVSPPAVAARLPPLPPLDTARLLTAGAAATLCAHVYDEARDSDVIAELNRIFGLAYFSRTEAAVLGDAPHSLPSDHVGHRVLLAAPDRHRYETAGLPATVVLVARGTELSCRATLEADLWLALDHLADAPQTWARIKDLVNAEVESALHDVWERLRASELRVVLMGHSLGGYLMQGVALHVLTARSRAERAHPGVVDPFALALQLERCLSFDAPGLLPPDVAAITASGIEASVLERKLEAYFSYPNPVNMLGARGTRQDGRGRTISRCFTMYHVIALRESSTWGVARCALAASRSCVGEPTSKAGWFLGVAAGLASLALKAQEVVELHSVKAMAQTLCSLPASGPDRDRDGVVRRMRSWPTIEPGLQGVAEAWKRLKGSLLAQAQDPFGSRALQACENMDGYERWDGGDA